MVFVDEGVAKWGLKNFLGENPSRLRLLSEVVAPFKDGTTAGRLLKKRGDGGYMIIMQTRDAAARRKYIESNKLAKVIFSHSHDDAECIQYHPKSIAGETMFRCKEGWTDWMKAA